MHRASRSISLVLASAVLVVAGCGGNRDDGPAVTGDTSAAAQASNLRVADVELGRAVGADKKVTDETDSFGPNDTIYASVHTTGSSQSALLVARWSFEDGQVIGETSQSISQSGGDVWSEFHVNRPGGLPKGKYKVEILVNGQSAVSVDLRDT